jgi:hypothetical protein
MHTSALPVLTAFQTLLLGHAARRARPPVPPEVLGAKSLSQLRALFGWLIPDRRWQGPSLEPSRRKRFFTPLITFWAFLSQVLSVDSACRTAVRKVQAWWVRQGGGPLSANPSAYGQARARLAEATLEALQDQLARAAGKQRARRALMVWPPGPGGRRHPLLDARHGSQSGRLPPSRVAREPAAASRC